MIIKMAKKGVKLTDIKPILKQPKESKEDLFNRLAKQRVEKVLKALRILGNCSNKSNYAYTPEQIDKMAITLSKALENTIIKFHDTKREEESFEF